MSGYRDFMWKANDYINSLEEPMARGEYDLLDAEEWTAWIESDLEDRGEEMTAEQIYWIVEKLEADGFVR